MSDKLAKRPEGGHESPFTRIRRVSAAGTPIPRWGYNGAPKCRCARRLAPMVVHPKGIGGPSTPDSIRGKRAPKGGGPSVWLCQRRGREWPSLLGNKSSSVGLGQPSAEARHFHRGIWRETSSGQAGSLPKSWVIRITETSSKSSKRPGWLVSTAGTGWRIISLRSPK